PDLVGTRAGLDYVLELESGETRQVLLRLSAVGTDPALERANALLERRRQEADDFYAHGFGSERLSDDARLVQRQAFAGLLWTKQVYIWDISRDPKRTRLHPRHL